MCDVAYVKSTWFMRYQQKTLLEIRNVVINIWSQSSNCYNFASALSQFRHDCCVCFFFRYEQNYVDILRVSCMSNSVILYRDGQPIVFSTIACVNTFYIIQLGRKMFVFTISTRFFIKLFKNKLKYLRKCDKTLDSVHFNTYILCR